MSFLTQWFTKPESKILDNAELAATPEREVATGSAATKTTQISRDAEAPYHAFYIPRNRYQRYDLFQKTYDEIAILQQAVEALVLLTAGDLVGCSGDSEVDQFVIDLLEKINYAETLTRSLRSYFVFGNSAEEIVWSADFRELVTVKNIASTTLYIRKDQFGVITDYLQIPPMLWFLSGRTPRAEIPYSIKIPTERVIYCPRNPLGDSTYGTSLIQPLLTSGLPRTMQLLEQSKGIIVQRHAAYPQHFNFAPRPGDRFTEKEADSVMKKLKAALGKREIDQDVYTSGPITNVPLFQSGGINIAQDQQWVVEQVMAAVGLTAELFGYSFGHSQTQVGHKLAVMLDRIQRIRKQREWVLNTVLMPAIEATYNLPITPKVKFEQLVLGDAKLHAEQQSILIVVVQQLLRMGLIDFEYAASMLNLPQGLLDPEKAEAWLEKQLTTPTPTNEMNQTRNQVSEEKEVTDNVS